MYAFFQSVLTIKFHNNYNCGPHSCVVFYTLTSSRWCTSPSCMSGFNDSTLPISLPPHSNMTVTRPRPMDTKRLELFLWNNIIIYYIYSGVGTSQVWGYLPDHFSVIQKVPIHMHGLIDIAWDYRWEHTWPLKKWCLHHWYIIIIYKRSYKISHVVSCSNCTISFIDFNQKLKKVSVRY